jgi:hypothetical protein
MTQQAPALMENLNFSPPNLANIVGSIRILFSLSVEIVFPGNQRNISCLWIIHTAAGYH